MELSLRMSWMKDNGEIYRIGDQIQIEILGHETFNGVIEDLDNTTMWFLIDGTKTCITIDMEDIWGMEKLI